MSQLPDQQDIIELEMAQYKHWYSRALFLVVAGLVFVCVPFIMAWLWIREKVKR